MHPSLVEKPALSVADLHLLAKALIFAEGLSDAEADRAAQLDDLFGAYLTDAVGPDWLDMEALVA